MAKQSASVIEVDPQVARIESMKSKELDEMLAHYHIDPKPTIESVNKLVADWKKRRKKS